ncbi:hypothetical protein BY458DRAFT_437660 [Sporodiniella umbellata]|nr:hypothetical protein BY458DRAFT_437660 [Sporodiniella umbellata]
MNPSKTDGKTDQAIGSAKQAVGNVFGNEELEAKGNAQHSSGKIEETAANVQGYVQGLTDQVSGAIKGAYNSLTGHSGHEAANKAEEKAGEAQKKWNS